MITETAQKVLEERYFLKNEKGELLESKWDDVATRVSSYFATSAEEDSMFYDNLSEMNWLPNSPTLMNAGTSLKSYSACFVLPVEDSIESIFKYYSDAAKISKSGGGVGANFSSIRKRDSKVQTTGGVASGPISFMEGQNALTEVIKQGGRRRGANMMILDIDHGDITDFISAKDTPGVLENANLSVRVTDKFMLAVKEGREQEFSLFDEITKRAWSSAEPGILFGDTIERGNTTPQLGKIVSTNPCRLCTI